MPINQKHTDPTYLRTIVDGLSSGALQKDNPSALPQGLVGVYEEAIPPASQVTERMKFLGFFGVWALMKKEVSAEFVVSLLDGWPEEEVLAFIGRYSKWFNSPVSGVYTLYHERFRTFVLQKIAESEILSVNDRIIKLCKEKLILKQGDEYEGYALEHLSSHVLLAAMHSKEAGDELRKLAYDATLWNRQIKVSNRFDWSKKMLDEMFQWALKYDESQILECSLSKVDLHYIEQNDAPQIIDMVANGEVELALERIESFGGSDKEGVQRKFILYMLCLMELTLLGSKDKPFRKSGIEQLLSHLDEHLPNDDSILNWNDFFSPYLMFQLACEWAALELDNRAVYKRTDYWGMDWISKNGPYTDLQFGVLMECARGISDDVWRSMALKEISAKIAQQGKVVESLAIARAISDDFWKSITLKDISLELSKQFKEEESRSVLRESLTIALDISDERGKSSALSAISGELSKHGMVEVSATAMQEALTIARSISSDKQKSFALNDISMELSKQGLEEESTSVMQESLAIVRGIRDDRQKRIALNNISIVISNLGKIGESLGIARGISDENWKSSALKAISVEMSKQGMVEESLAVAREISNDYWKSRALNAISIELSKHGTLEESASALRESLAIARGINTEWERSSVLMEFSAELSEQGRVEESASLMQESLTFSRGINSDWKKSSVLKQISVELFKLGQMKESLAIARAISDDFWKSSALCEISVELCKRGQVDESRTVIRGINDDYWKSSALCEISLELSKQGQVEKSTLVLQESLTIARLISNDNLKINTLTNISVELSKQEKEEESASVIQESLFIARGISSDRLRSVALKDISAKLFRNGQLDESLAITQGISDGNERSSVLMHFAVELSKQGQMEKSASMMQESLTIARAINDESERSSALMDIAVELSKLGNLSIAEVVGLEIPRIAARQEGWKEMAHTKLVFDGYQKSMWLAEEFQSEEAKQFYRIGWADYMNLSDSDAACIMKALPWLARDKESIETLLQKHALHELFFGNACRERIKRLNRTLNIQWALDIKSSLSAG